MNTDINSQEMDSRRKYVEAQQAIARKALEILESPNLSPLSRDGLKQVISDVEGHISFVNGEISAEEMKARRELAISQQRVVLETREKLARIKRLSANETRVTTPEPDDFAARIKRLNGETNGD